jgi:hypothetical protein
MVRLYADEQFPYPVVERLRARGYDILTVQTAGKDNQRIPDEDVLSLAFSKVNLLTIFQTIEPMVN